LGVSITNELGEIDRNRAEIEKIMINYWEDAMTTRFSGMYYITGCGWMGGRRIDPGVGCNNIESTWSLWNVTAGTV
jgi:hypothetical protein